MGWTDPKKRNEYMRKWRKKNPLTKEQIKKTQERKKKLRLKYKEQLVKYFGGKCTKCGYNKSIHALEFHHKNPKEKDHTISRNVSYKRMLEEAKKCILLCANCHREIHAEEW